MGADPPDLVEIKEDGVALPATPVYYLRTIAPHIHNTEVAGPYRSVDAVAKQMRRDLEICVLGSRTADETVSDDHAGNLIETTIPSNGSPDFPSLVVPDVNTKTANPPLAPVCYIVVEARDLSAGRLSAKISDTATSLGAATPVLVMGVFGTVNDHAASFLKARQIAQGVASWHSGGQVTEQPAADGESCAVRVFAVFHPPSGRNNNGERCATMMGGIGRS